MPTTITLHDGSMTGGCFEQGTYTVAGDRITFHSSEYGTDSTVTFKRADNGDLTLTPVPPMDPRRRLSPASTSPGRRTLPEAQQAQGADGTRTHPGSRRRRRPPGWATQRRDEQAMERTKLTDSVRARRCHRR